MGRTDAARATFEEVVKRFPDSQGAQLARQRLAGPLVHPLHHPPSPDLGCHSPIVDFTRQMSGLGRTVTLARPQLLQP